MLYARPSVGLIAFLFITWLKVGLSLSPAMSLYYDEMSDHTVRSFGKIDLLEAPHPKLKHTMFIHLVNVKQAAFDKFVSEIVDPTHAKYQQWVTRDELHRVWCRPDNKAAKMLVAWLNSGPQKVNHEQYGTMFKVVTTVANVERLFQTTMNYYEYHEPHGRSNKTRRFVAQSGTSFVPSQLLPHIAHISGLINGPRMNRMFVPQDVQGVWDPSDIAQRYQYPNPIPVAAKIGSSSVGVMQILPGENYVLADLALWGKNLHYVSDLASLPSIYSIDGNPIVYSMSGDVDDESMLDLDAVMSVSVNTRVSAIICANADVCADNANSFINSLLSLPPQQHALPQVISLSYGAYETEIGNTAYSRRAIAMGETNLQKLAALGITFLASSGDNSHRIGASYPCSSAWALCVGGTQFSPNGESAWFSSRGTGSSGGPSIFIPKPSYQKGAAINTGRTKMRNTPDVAALAWNFYTVYGPTPSAGAGGGTSLASPLFATMITFMNELALGMERPPLGFINPLIYQMRANCSQCFNDITSGTSDDGTKATKGWDELTGIGSPNVAEIIKWLNGFFQKIRRAKHWRWSQ